jgi:hypothetical protein
LWTAGGWGTVAVKAGGHLIRERDRLAGDAAGIGGDDEELKSVQIAGPGEDAIPLGGGLAGDISDDEVGEGIDATARAAAEQRFGADVEFELDEGVGGGGDQ